MSDRTGVDGLLEPPDEFRTPPWFIILIFAAVVISLGVGLAVLL